MELLSKIAVIEPPSAYFAFTSGFKPKVTCIMRTISDIYQHLRKLHHYVGKAFITAFIDGIIPSNIEKELPLLPVRIRCMGIVIFTDNAKTEYQNSRNLTESLTKLHLEQSTAYNINKEII